MKTLPVLVLALLAAAYGPLRGDETLRRAFERRVLDEAAALSCTAQVWAPALERYAAPWGISSEPVLPGPGAWSRLTVELSNPGLTVTARAEVQIRLESCVSGWSVTKPLSQGSPLDASSLRAGLFDPRSLAGPLAAGPLPAGAVAARALMPDRPLLKADLMDPAGARAGDKVTLMVRLGDIEAGDEGVLLDGGGEGSLLRAQHCRSGKVVRGRLSGRILMLED